MKKLSLLKVPVYLLVILSVVAFATGYFISNKTNPASNPVQETSAVNHIVSASKMDQIRLGNYNLVRPLLLTDLPNENSSLYSIKTKIEQYIQQAKSSDKATDVSVYFRKLDEGSYFSINPGILYNPASMIKIIYMLTYLKEAETNPAVLNKQIFFTRHFSEGNIQNIVDFHLTENKFYTVRQLMSFMIQHSDNDATILLSQNMNQKIYNQLFASLQIDLPDPVREYYINVSDYSKFFRVLYNATYLQPELSEYGLNLLTTSTYMEGLRKQLPPNVIVAHKFGERIIGNKAQLHEFGIVFINNNPYLIGVMTSGSNLKDLQNVVATISKIAYDSYLQLLNS